MDLKSQKIVITGGAGFLGRYIINELENKGCTIFKHFQEAISDKPGLYIVRSATFNLTKPHHVSAVFNGCRPDIVIHAAAVVGGIGANKERPGEFYYKNIMMGTEIIEQARIHKTNKLVLIGTVCMYPCHTPAPFSEDSLWDGYPEATNAPYGIAKKAMLVQAQAYRQQYGLNSIFMIPVNLYGPGDNFNPSSSHVIPALIKKCVEAKANNIPYIECWGTGNATREFIHAADAARAIVLATENYNGSDPINIGSGHDISIRDLVTMIADIVGYTGDIRFNPTYPDGQPKRLLDVSRAERLLGFKAAKKLKEGLEETFRWYQENLVNKNL